MSAPLPVRPAEIPRRSRGLVAVRTIKPGKVILVDSPLLVYPSQIPSPSDPTASALSTPRQSPTLRLASFSSAPLAAYPPPPSPLPLPPPPPPLCRCCRAGPLHRCHPRSFPLPPPTSPASSPSTAVCLSYFPVNWGYKERQRRLLEDYGFQCECDKCMVENDCKDDDDDAEGMGEGSGGGDEDGMDGVEEEEGGGDFSHAYLFVKFVCDREDYGGTFAPLPPSPEGMVSDVMECNVCGRLKTEEEEEEEEEERRRRRKKEEEKEDAGGRRRKKEEEEGVDGKKKKEEEEGGGGADEGLFHPKKSISG